MSDIRVTVPTADPSDVTVPAGTTAAQLFEGDRSVVVARVNGTLRDLHSPVADGDVVEPVHLDSPDGLNVLRHSTAHVLAQAVQNVYPEAKLGIGPPIKDGFYYDFDVEQPFTPDDLVRIEKRMQEIVKAGQRFQRRVVDEQEARVELENEPYKLELIGLKGGSASDDVMEVGGAELTIYDNVDPRTGDRAWGDLCRGPHLPSTRLIPAFKLMRTAAAYWRGDQANNQLQRVYGTAWPSKEALKDHLTMLEEAERRDHRRLGVELTCLVFRTKSVRDSRSSTPRVASFVARWRTTHVSGTKKRATSSSIPRTLRRPRCLRLRVTSTGTPMACTRPCNSMPSIRPMVNCASRPRTTTSSL